MAISCFTASIFFLISSFFCFFVSAESFFAASFSLAASAGLASAGLASALLSSAGLASALLSSALFASAGGVAAAVVVEGALVGSGPAFLDVVSSSKRTAGEPARFLARISRAMSPSDCCANALAANKHITTRGRNFFIGNPNLTTLLLLLYALMATVLMLMKQVETIG